MKIPQQRFNPSASTLNLVDLIDEAMELSRSIWRIVFDEEMGEPEGDSFKFVDKSFENWWKSYLSSCPKSRRCVRLWLKNRLLDLRWLVQEKHAGTTYLRLEILRPTKFIEMAILIGKRSDRDYFMRRNIRRKYGYDQSPETVRVFNLLAATANVQIRDISSDQELKKHAGIRAGYQRRSERIRRVLHYRDGLSEPLVRTLMKDGMSQEDAQRHRCVFLECCRIAGFVGPHPSKRGAISILAEDFDAEFLLCKLFGLPSEMAGLDSLFGGGGIALAEASGSSDTPPIGRVVLIRGRFGSGKSSLALGLAAEVARKQGLAWVMPLEQSAQDCRFYLESMNALSSSDAVHMVQDIGKLGTVLGRKVLEAKSTEPVPDQLGVIVLLQADKGNLDAVFEEVIQKAEATKAFPLRLLVLDPINSLIGWEPEQKDPAKLRDTLMRAFDRIKQSGANLLLVAEDGAKETTEDRNPARFVENLADSVIDLSVEPQHGYSQRFIEILKSRFQRDQRGKHPFSIKAGLGVTVSPSSASVLARIQNRRFKSIDKPARYGWAQLDDKLGPNAFFPGDTIVLRGSEGSFKTHIGLLFLLGSDMSRRPGARGVRRSLILPIRENPAYVNNLLKSHFVTAHRSRQEASKARDHISVVPTPVGFVSPGAIFEALEQEFEKANLAGDVIDRVMIGSLSHWEISCPFIREDDTFGDTLIEFLRRHEVTSLFICSPKGHPDSVLQSSVVDGADCLMDFQRIEFRGAQRVTLRILKTRGMGHKPESFDVILSDQGLELGLASKLLRVGASGAASPVLTRLYLHQENMAHAMYNTTIEESLKPVLSRSVKVNSKDRTHLVRAIKLSPYSSVDELQIVQLDEFQLPELAEGFPNNLLHNFEIEEWENKQWGDMSPRLIAQVRRPKVSEESEKDMMQGGKFFAVPYYNNIGFLAFCADACNMKQAQDWSLIAKACREWEQEKNGGRKHPDRVFFHFKTNIDENYNCLLFEILLSLGSKPPTALPARGCKLRKWLKDPLLGEACRILRILCYRVHKLSSSLQKEFSAERVPRAKAAETNDAIEDLQDERTQNNSKGLTALQQTAKIWRHWFTTLSEMLDQMSDKERANIVTTSLPGEKSVAGEWYLAVPAYSAAPDVALEVIRVLTTREEELQRLRRGVGLPTRDRYYEPGSLDVPESGFLGIPASKIGRLLKNSFRRSEFDCYPEITKILSFHLKKIVSIEERAGVDITEEINRQIKALEKDVTFVLDGIQESRCKDCLTGVRKT